METNLTSPFDALASNLSHNKVDSFALGTFHALTFISAVGFELSFALRVTHCHLTRVLIKRRVGASARHCRCAARHGAREAPSRAQGHHKR